MSAESQDETRLRFADLGAINPGPLPTSATLAPQQQQQHRVTRVLDNLDLKLFASELAEPIFVESTDNPVTHARSEVAEPPLPQPPAAVLTVEDAVDNIIGATNNDDDREYEFDKICPTIT